MLTENPPYKSKGPEAMQGQLSVEVCSTINEDTESICIQLFPDSPITQFNQDINPKKSGFKNCEEFKHALTDPTILKVIVRNGVAITGVYLFTSHIASLSKYQPTNMIHTDSSDGKPILPFLHSTPTTQGGHYRQLEAMDVWSDDNSLLRGDASTAYDPRQKIHPLTNFTLSQASQAQACIDQDRIQVLVDQVVSPHQPAEVLNAAAIAAINALHDHLKSSFVLLYHYTDTTHPTQSKKGIPGTISNMLSNQLDVDTHLAIQDYWYTKADHVPADNGLTPHVEFVDPQSGSKYVIEYTDSSQRTQELASLLTTIETECFYETHQGIDVNDLLADQRWSAEDYDKIISFSPEKVEVLLFKQNDHTVGFMLHVTPLGLTDPEVIDTMLTLNPNSLPSDVKDRMVYIANFAIGKQAQGQFIFHLKEMLAQILPKYAKNEIAYYGADTLREKTMFNLILTRRANNLPLTMTALQTHVFALALL